MKRIVFKNRISLCYMTPEMEKNYNEVMKGKEKDDLFNEVFESYYHYHNKPCKIYHRLEENKHVFYISFSSSKEFKYDPAFNDKIIFNSKDYVESFNHIKDCGKLNSFVQNYKIEDVDKLDLK